MFISIIFKICTDIFITECSKLTAKNVITFAKLSALVQRYSRFLEREPFIISLNFSRPISTLKCNDKTFNLIL